MKKLVFFYFLFFITLTLIFEFIKEIPQKNWFVKIIIKSAKIDVKFSNIEHLHPHITDHKA